MQKLLWMKIMLHVITEIIKGFVKRSFITLRHFSVNATTMDRNDQVGKMGGFDGKDSYLHKLKETVQKREQDTSDIEKGFNKYAEYWRAKVRIMLGLNTDTVDLYSAEALTRLQTDRTRWQRVLDIFQADEYGNTSGERAMIVSTSVIGFLAGGVYGAYTQTIGTGLRQRFIDYHKTTIFERPQEARARLADTVVYHGYRGFVKYGFKVSLLSGTFCTIVAVITALKNQSGIIEYTAGAFTMGALWSANRGLTASMLSGCVGGVLGTLTGSLNYGMQKFRGHTYEEIALAKKVRSMNAIKRNLELARQFKEGVDLSQPSPPPALRMHEAYRQAELLFNDTNEALTNAKIPTTDIPIAAKISPASAVQ